ncbi:hypothetical protein RRG08_047594 [Elysia crispata]|uniref:Hexosyltransferase n=1 Tax=Elysia crispata TaxID=231223 RepID=A0AAE0XPC2_9GAST|nr:hypothetical protein RRG08_047594 [Elysia crispata]
MSNLTVQESHENILFTQVIDSAGRVVSPDRHNNYVPAASVIFSLSDAFSLQDHINRAPRLDASWEKNMTSTRIFLSEEMQLYEDIMLLDMKDVYRNLPLKIALCHQRFHRYTVPEYVMKTDDDCFINLPGIVRLLQEMPKDVPTWWGNFRQYWVVERHGKWKEDLYSSSIYPEFACGSGSVLSRSLSSWLSSNAHRLQLFQGEDVSLGVWLAGLRIRHIRDQRWRCERTCQDCDVALEQQSVLCWAMLFMLMYDTLQKKRRWKKRLTASFPFYTTTGWKCRVIKEFSKLRYKGFLKLIKEIIVYSQSPVYSRNCLTYR